MAGNGLAGAEELARLKERIDKRLRGIARDIADLVKDEVGLDIETGGEIVKVDMGRLTALRGAVEKAAEEAAGKKRVEYVEGQGAGRVERYVDDDASTIDE